MRSSPLRDALETIAASDGRDVQPLAQLVQALRPSRAERKRNEFPRFLALLQLLEHQEDLRVGLARYVKSYFGPKAIGRTLTDAGMPSGSFWHELRQRLTYKVLPFQPPPETLDHALINAFFQESDADWVSALPDDAVARLLELLGIDGIDARDRNSLLLQELFFAAKVLGLRIAGRAFDGEVLRMVPEHASFNSPFVRLEDELDRYLDQLRMGTVSRRADDAARVPVMAIIAECHIAIADAYRNTERLGITFRVNQHLMLMERKLKRLELVLNAIAPKAEIDGRFALARLFKALVQISSGRTRVLGFIKDSTQVVAREITQHTGRKGEHYITSTKREYMAMLRSALGGGAIVAVACVLKAWYGSIEGSLFFHAFLYSMNYAMAFIAIYLLHLTLATKQPAMTAATISRALDEGRRDGRVEYGALADLVARVWRSQFVAFVGNVAMAFPVGVALAYGWNALFGPELLEHKSAKMMHELDPFQSLAIPHAAIAGVFLFISGLIAGSITNASIHRNVPQRSQEHPALKLVMGAAWRQRLARAYENHAGGVISNFWFGVFMGSVGAVGAFLGLSLDIRHITFAAGNLALGLVGNGWTTTAYVVFASVLGIGLIGLFNFLVSFTLSLSLAMRSRGVPFSELLRIAIAVRARFSEDPKSFFLPPREAQPEVLPDSE
ncbi:MAG: recombinase [Flavobacteriales bacterium]